MVTLSYLIEKNKKGLRPPIHMFMAINAPSIRETSITQHLKRSMLSVMRNECTPNRKRRVKNGMGKTSKVTPTCHHMTLLTYLHNFVVRIDYRSAYSRRPGNKYMFYYDVTADGVPLRVPIHED